MESFLKKSGCESIVTSVIFAILGIILFLKPDGVLRFVSIALAAIFIIYGIAKIVQYFISKGNYNFYNYDFIYGIISIIVGVVTLFCINAIEAIFRIIIGIWIIYSAITRLDFSFKLKSMELRNWILVFTLAILMLLCGIFILLNKGVLIATIGVLITVYSIMDLIESIIFMRNVKDMF